MQVNIWALVLRVKFEGQPRKSKSPGKTNQIYPGQVIKVKTPMSLVKTLACLPMLGLWCCSFKEGKGELINRDMWFDLPSLLDGNNVSFWGKERKDSVKEMKEKKICLMKVAQWLGPLFKENERSRFCWSKVFRCNQALCS